MKKITLLLAIGILSCNAHSKEGQLEKERIATFVKMLNFLHSNAQDSLKSYMLFSELDTDVIGFQSNFRKGKFILSNSSPYKTDSIKMLDSLTYPDGHKWYTYSLNFYKNTKPTGAIRITFADDITNKVMNVFADQPIVVPEINEDFFKKK